MLAECRHTLVGPSGPRLQKPWLNFTGTREFETIVEDSRQKIISNFDGYIRTALCLLFHVWKKMMLRFSGEEKSHDVVAKYAMSFLLFFSFVTQVVSWLADKCEMRSLWAISLLDVTYLNVRTTNVLTDSYFCSTNRLQLRDVFSVSVSPRCQDEIWGIA